MEKIDFVIPWVDGSDINWLTEKNKYKSRDFGISGEVVANSEIRYRDNGLLKYWFRGVETFAPWVNKIHFVTCGQKPDWLNENHPKLNLVNHRDYIPEQFLPTFNANTIELNYHRIKELVEKFVYFNDDTFLLQSVEPEFFFRDGVPVLETNLRYLSIIGYDNWSRLLFNDYCIICKSFDTNKSIWENRKKWFCVSKLGYKRAGRNLLCFIANRTLPVGQYCHLALPHLKSTFQEVWDKWPDVMYQVSKHKFRADDQVNQWLLCAWNQAKGDFYPVNGNSLGKRFSLCPSELDCICETIKKQSLPQICINENALSHDMEYCSVELVKAFESILPHKSEFEI
jgi:hypothetical protein